MYATFFLLTFLVYQSHAFSCPSDSGVYINPDDYRSYYVCTNRCSKLESCAFPAIYFTRTSQTCIREPPDWRTLHDLSGQFKSPEKTDIFIRQEGYKVYISHETSSTHFAVIARYINETHAIGIQTAHRLENNCVAVFNVRIVATDYRAHCFYETVHPYSTKCDLPENYSGNYCETY